MSTNSMPKTCLSDDEESLLFSLNGLDIKDENKPNEGSGTNVEERPRIPILIKKDHNSQIQMTNNGINFDNVPEEPPQSQQLLQPPPTSQQSIQPCQLLQSPQPQQSRQSNNNVLMPRRQRKPKSVDKGIIQMLMETQIIPEDLKTMQYIIDAENIVYVNGKGSPYSPVYYKAPFTMFDQTYTSVDDAYQVSKLNDLCGETYAQGYLQKRTVADKRAYMRECTKFTGLSKDDIINWRMNSGLDVVFNATVQKFMQNEELLEMMKNDKDKLIVNIYGNDPIDGCGSQENVEMWIESARGTTCVIPCEINPTNLTNFPTIGGGKNIQGVMVMLARYSIASNLNW